MIIYSHFGKVSDLIVDRFFLVFFLDSAKSSADRCVVIGSWSPSTIDYQQFQYSRQGQRRERKVAEQSSRRNGTCEYYEIVSIDCIFFLFVLRESRRKFLLSRGFFFL